MHCNYADLTQTIANFRELTGLLLSRELLAKRDVAAKRAWEVLGFGLGQALGDPDDQQVFGSAGLSDELQSVTSEFLSAVAGCEDCTESARQMAASVATDVDGKVYGSDLSRFLRRVWPVIQQLFRDIFNLD